MSAACGLACGLRGAGRSHAKPQAAEAIRTFGLRYLTVPRHYDAESGERRGLSGSSLWRAALRQAAAPTAQQPPRTTRLRPCSVSMPSGWALGNTSPGTTRRRCRTGRAGRNHWPSGTSLPPSSGRRKPQAAPCRRDNGHRNWPAPTRANRPGRRGPGAAPNRQAYSHSASHGSRYLCPLASPSPTAGHRTGGIVPGHFLHRQPVPLEIRWFLAHDLAILLLRDLVNAHEKRGMDEARGLVLVVATAGFVGGEPMMNCPAGNRTSSMPIEFCSRSGSGGVMVNVKGDSAERPWVTAHDQR